MIWLLQEENNMSADYTLWKPKTKEKFLLWNGEWEDILGLEDCKLTKFETSKEYILSKLNHYGYESKAALSLVDKILNFCDDEIVLTNDCGREYFSDDDIFNGIKDTYKVIYDRCS